MSTTNPLADNAPTDPDDHVLVLRARSGDREALEELVRHHQGWIYNIALRMVFYPQDAEDATQEILLKAVTSLSSFEGRSSFRTWLYRMVVNHVLNMKRGRAEQAVISFSAYGQAIDDTPDLDPPDPGIASPEVRLLVDETMVACTSRMLLCLDREQRLTYILGQIFGVTDTVAAEVLEISGESFRQRLTRARRDLRNFMNDRCGLVNQSNPCDAPKRPPASSKPATSIRRICASLAIASVRCARLCRKRTRPSGRWMTSVRISTVGTRSISRRTWSNDCGS